jgi:hypothetical protein
MMTRIHGRFYFECDECADGLDAEKTDFQEALAVARECEWTSEKPDEKWHHHCGAGGANASRPASVRFELRVGQTRGSIGQIEHFTTLCR